MDTNSLISASPIEGATTAKELDKAISTGTLIFSHTTMDEFTEVLFRKKFDRYFLDNEENWNTIQRISLNARFFLPTETITACRDPKDNKFLELAVAANASCIITGDDDLLALHPCLPDRQAFRNIPILSPADFIKKF